VKRHVNNNWLVTSPKGASKILGIRHDGRGFFIEETAIFHCYNCNEDQEYIFTVFCEQLVECVDCGEKPELLKVLSS